MRVAASHSITGFLYLPVISLQPTIYFVPARAEDSHKSEPPVAVFHSLFTLAAVNVSSPLCLSASQRRETARPGGQSALFSLDTFRMGAWGSLVNGWKYHIKNGGGPMLRRLFLPALLS